MADFSYLRCWEGVVFFAFVIDVWSRRIVGWQLAGHMRTDLVLDALRMALARRRAGADVELVHHSDAGSQYTSYAFTQVLDDHGVLASIGSVGDAYDNALAESFVDSFKTELIADRVWRTRSQLELAIVEYVGWFNHDRLHEALGDIPPAEFEERHAPGRDFGQRIGRGALAEARRSPLRGSGLSANAPAGRKQHSRPLRTGGRLRRHPPLIEGNRTTRSPRNPARLTRPASPRSPSPRDATTACGSTAAATASSTARCTRSPSPAPAPAPKTRAYLDRKLAQGKTRPEAYRCLKRHLARRVWRLLHDLPDEPQPGARGAP